MSSRVGLRFARAGQILRTQFRQPLQRRMQTTTADTAAAEQPAQSGFSKFLNSPVGPKTVHFWAPIMKWGLVIAGISDFFRPTENLSLQQNLALMATGAIWTRWCFIIKPRNIFLATVNFFLFCVGSTQVTRIFLFRRSAEGKSKMEEAKQLATEEGKAVEGVVKDPVAAAKQAVK